MENFIVLIQVLHLIAISGVWMLLILGEKLVIKLLYGIGILEKINYLISKRLIIKIIWVIKLIIMNNNYC